MLFKDKPKTNQDSDRYSISFQLNKFALVDKELVVDDEMKSDDSSVDNSIQRSPSARFKLSRVKPEVTTKDRVLKPEMSNEDHVLKPDVSDEEHVLNSEVREVNHLIKTEVSSTKAPTPPSLRSIR